MATQTFPMEVFVETDPDRIPNGAYCTGGPTGNTINKLDVHVPEYTNAAKLREIVMAHLMTKMVDSGSSNGQAVKGKITAPDTVNFGPMSLQLSIDSIKFRGGELALHEKELTAGDGYEVKFSQAVMPACCVVL